MNNDIFVLIEYMDQSLSDVAYEMLAKARTLADQWSSRVTAVVLGDAVTPLISLCGAADRILAVEHSLLSGFSPEAYVKSLRQLFDVNPPGLLMIPCTSMGLDIASPLSLAMGIPLIVSCREIVIDGDSLSVTSQLYGGKMFVDSRVMSEAAIVAVLPGSFPMAGGNVQREIPVERFLPNLADLASSFVGWRLPSAEDVDITQQPILVSVGRGVQNADNISLAQELSEVLGGTVSASRPVVDQGWLPSTRQVGRSGMTVKPKLYLALGISGAPEHVEGMKSSESIIAINTDRHAPIFNVAEYGIVGDMFDILPVVIEKLRART